MALQLDMAKGSCNPRTWHIVSALAWQLPEGGKRLLCLFMSWLKVSQLLFYIVAEIPSQLTLKGLSSTAAWQVLIKQLELATCHLSFLLLLFFKFVFFFTRTKTFPVAVFNYLAGKVRQQQVRFSGNTHASYVCWKFVYAMRIRTVRPRWRSYSLTLFHVCVCVCVRWLLYVFSINFCHFRKYWITKYCRLFWRVIPFIAAFKDQRRFSARCSLFVLSFVF